MNPSLGVSILRLGLAAVIFWFGLSQLLDASMWLSWVPQWATSLTGLTPQWIVFLNGWFEVVIATALALNIYARYAAFILAIHMFGLVVEIGLSAIGMRDLAIGFAALALGFLVQENH